MLQNSISLRIKNELFSFTKPVVMGIMNITPDSFYSKSRTQAEADILRRAEEILTQGGEIIDIGAYSTRPTAAEITANEEAERLFGALKLITREFPQAILSVDTFRAEIADAAISHYGANMVNDVSGGTLDGEMFHVMARHNVPYILMHMRGTPQTMQSLTTYDNFPEDILLYFAEKIKHLTELGVSDIILDPGFGFAKTMDQNFELLKNLPAFRIFDRPILAGLSRKSMLYKTLNTNAENALSATIAANTLALANGAHILRVHDVKEAVDTIAIYEKSCGATTQL